MEMKHYQDKTGETAKSYKACKIPLQELVGIVAVLNASRATTEIAGALKKKVFHGHDKFVDKRNYQSMLTYAHEILDKVIKVPTTTELMQPEDLKYVDTVLGLVDESGEVAEALLKFLNKEFTKEEMNKKLADELGDVMWYIARVAEAAGYPLDAVAQGNIDKLQARYPKGFTSEDSQHRDAQKEEEAVNNALEKPEEAVDLKTEALLSVKDTFEKLIVKEGKVVIKAHPDEYLLLQETYNKVIKALEVK